MKTQTKFKTKKGAMIAKRHFVKTNKKFTHKIVGTTLISTKKKKK